MSKSKGVIVSSLVLERRIYLVREQRVMVDFELAELYGVTTFQLNQQVKRNVERFPDDFAFQITQEEFVVLRSQFATSKEGHGGRRKLPWVFTEHGVAMLSSVLRSETAVRVNIEIVRTFVKLRKLLATPGELVNQIQELAKTVQLHDDQIKVISDVLNKMLTPPPSTPAKTLGFHTIPAKKGA